MMLAAYAGCDANMVGLYFIISAGSQGLLPASTFMVPMDLSPNYAGTITAITDGLGSITGVFEPWIFGLLTPNVSTNLNSIEPIRPEPFLIRSKLINRILVGTNLLSPFGVFFAGYDG